MKTSELGKTFVKSFEKCKLAAYIDAVGVPTIAWGRTTNVKLGDTCTQADADEWFDEEAENFEEDVERMVTAPMTQRQFDALVSFAYNVGSGALRGSTLLRHLNKQDYVDAANQFCRWDKGTVDGKLTVLPGLTKRRIAEAKIFSFGIYDMHDSESVDGNVAITT